MFSIIACGDDRGVANNNGRVGASGGPLSFWKYFEKIKTRSTAINQVKELQLVDLAADIEATHQSVVDALVEQHKNSPLSIFVGGGHDYAYPHLEGIQKAINGSVGCINIDPHFDLRKPNPEILSGSPFYMAIENEILKGSDLVEFGIGEHCNGPELWEYANSKKVEICTFPEIRKKDRISEFAKYLENLSKRVENIVISLDLDAIQAAYAPGVSAPAAEGFTPSEILGMIEISAKNEKVCSFGIYELNPKYDIDNRTARLAALTAFEFIHNKIL